MLDDAEGLNRNHQTCQGLSESTGVDGETHLFTAARFNSIESLQWLISQDSKINHRNDYGQTAIFFITSAEAGKILLSQGANITLKDRYGSSALSMSFENDRLDLAHFFLDSGAQISSYDLNTASNYYKWETLKFIASVASEKEIQGEGEFFRTFSFYDQMNRDLAAEFISKGADLNKARLISSQKSLLQSYVEDYVLHTTQFQRFGTAAIEFLVKNGAHTNQNFARKGKSLIAYLLTKQDFETNNQLLDLFLSNGLKLDSVRAGKTLLMELAFYSQRTENEKLYIEKIAKRLLQLNANPNIQGEGGLTALHHAIRWENISLAKVLIEGGIDLQLKDHRGLTAKAYALERLEQTPDHGQKLRLVNMIRMMK